MKVALCLSGQPRFYEAGFKEIKTHLIERYNIEDVFCHFWWNPETQDQGNLASWNYVYYGHSKPYLTTNNILKDLNKFYSPKKIINDYPKLNIDVSLQKLNDYKEEYVARHESGEVLYFKDYAPEYKIWAYNHLKSMFESIYLVNQYKKNYENSINQKYDLVIRTRYDIAFQKPDQFPSLEEIMTKVKLNARNYYRDWTDLWVYSSQVHNLVVDGIWHNFDRLFNYITSPHFVNPYPWVRLQASAEHMYWARLMELGLYPQYDNELKTEFGIFRGII
jgi:hypothetical protein